MYSCLEKTSPSFYSLHADPGKFQIPPKIMGHVVMFPIFPLTWLMTDCVHVVLLISRSRNCPFQLRLTLGFVNRMPKFLGEIKSCLLNIKYSSSCDCNSSYTRHIIIVLVQLFCSILCNHKKAKHVLEVEICKHKRSITHFRRRILPAEV